ncbi:MAG: hypothetical protein ABSF56_03490 [Minisyncoccia bacterium]|jgi:hypothetical protein
MTEIIEQTHNIAAEYRARMTLCFIVLAAAAVLFYAFNLYAVVSRTVALSRVQSETAAAGSAVASLDAEYLGLSSALTPDSLGAHGLVQGKVSAYIERPASTASIGPLASVGHEL